MGPAHGHTPPVTLSCKPPERLYCAFLRQAEVLGSLKEHCLLGVKKC